ncbi:uncharacterized protein LOC114526670, partial [Dendronephthya gigantea]|uniref:uncharacterized protein LOC114526670 n=1 Tax=Dendronephthya gigantea TaxID=151771 RepID=UPI00106DC79F
MKINTFLEQQRWIRGPEFLWKPEIEWPKFPETIKEISHCDEEIKIVQSTIVGQKDILKRLEYFSQWHSVRKIVAWILRLMKPKCKRLIPESKGNIKKSLESKPKPITVDEIEKAEAVILKLTQKDAFLNEIVALKEVLAENHTDNRAKKRSENLKIKKTSSLFRLDPYIDEHGLLRVGGRLSKSTELSDDAKHPVILPKKSHVTTLVIRHCHEKVAHAGRGITLNELRSKYWVINANSRVRHYISKCVGCRRLRAAVSQQKMADLPADRVTQAPPFTYCAVDYFGPYYIKEG